MWNRGAVTEGERVIAPDFFALSEVSAGLTAGEQVVVRDVAALSDGMRVNAVQTDRTAGP